MNKNIVLYGANWSPAVRTVQLTLKTLNLEFQQKPIDPHKGETQTEDYLKKNPAHTIPCLEDDGKYISDSHAIIAYLASKYGKDDTLYPKDLYQRAIVDQMLHLENSVIFQTVKKHFRVLTAGNEPRELVDEAIKDLRKIYDLLEVYLNRNKYIAGDNLTIADLSVLTSISMYDVFTPVDPAKWPKLAAWLAALKKLPFYDEVNGVHLKNLEAWVNPALEKYNK